LKKFLIGFGGFLMLLGVGGIINHISMAFKAVQEEQDMYGSSVQFMILQLISTMSPYIICLIGGGIIIAIAAFLNEYQKRSELTSQLIQVLSEQRTKSNEIETKESYTKREDDHKTTTTAAKLDIVPQLDTSPKQDDERFYWNG
jgi:hypothetical protein